MNAKTTKNAGKNGGDRPSLYSFNKSERESGEVFSILDALEPRRRISAIWPRLALVGIVVSLAAALYVVGRDVDVYHRLSPVAANETVVVHSTAKQEVPAPSSATSGNESGAATIVMEAPQLHLEPQQASNSVVGPMMEDQSESTIAAPDKTHLNESDSVNTPSVSGADPKKTSKNGATERQPQAKVTAHAHERGSRPTQHMPATAKSTAAAAAGKDDDVELIAALVSHVSRGETSDKEVRKKSAKAMADARPAGGGRKERRTDARHDIVVRNDGDSTETLVSRCRALGIIEGELCRLRICSGLWGVDPACPGAREADPQLSSGR